MRWGIFGSTTTSDTSTLVTVRESRPTQLIKFIGTSYPIDFHVMVDPQAPNNYKKRRIVAVGAGPSGLAALRVYTDELKEEIASDECEIICFEKRDELGGVW